MNDLILKALRREPVPRRPLWIMRQAGRYLPEYRQLRERYSFEEMSGHPELAARVTLLPFERFELDAAIVFADIMSPIPALGVRFHFAPGPVIEAPIRSVGQVAALPDPETLDPEEIAPEVPATLRQVRAELDGRAALLGFGGAPLTLAAYLVEGRGAKNGFPRLRAFAHAEPAAFDALLGKLSSLVARYSIEQHRAGADAVQLFDSWAGLLPLRTWRHRVRPHLERLLRRLREAGVPRILFVQDAPHLIEEAVSLDVEAMAVDWREDLAALVRSHPERAWQGNLDPAILLAGSDATRAAARELMAQIPSTGHILNLGHGILPETPLESVAALVETVRGERRT